MPAFNKKAGISFFIKSQESGNKNQELFVVLSC